MRRRTILITLAGCGAALAVGVAIGGSSRSSAPPGRYQHLGLSVGSDTYRYTVYTPVGLRVGSAVPLLVVLHGCSTSADQQAAVSEYDPIAAQRRFVVVYPDVDPVDEAHGRCWKGIWEPGAEGRSRGDRRDDESRDRSLGHRSLPRLCHRDFRWGF